MKLYIYTIKIILAFSIIYYLIYTELIDFSNFLDSFSIQYHIFAVIILILVILIDILRWAELLKAQNIKLNIIDNIKLSWVTQFWSGILPGGASGDLIKILYCLRANKTKRVEISSSILYNRFIDILLSLCISTIFFLIILRYNNLSESIKNLGYFVITFTILIISSLYMIIKYFDYSKVPLNKVRKLKLLLASNVIYFEKNKANLKVIFFSILGNFLYIFVFYFAAFSLDIKISFFEMSFIIPFTYLSALIPLTPGGIGIAEANTAMIINFFNGATNGAMIMILVRIWLFIARFPGLLILLVNKDKFYISADK